MKKVGILRCMQTEDYCPGTTDLKVLRERKGAFSGAEEPECVVLTVSDNGPGIPPEDLPRVCDKGFTGQNGRSGSRASGMGLYLCRVLCGKMDVGFSVASPPGGGTSVSLRFPRSSLIEGVCYESVRKR